MLTQRDNVRTGMLANSHTGLVNADIKGPTRLADLNRGKDPGTGGSTTYHDVHFTAIGNITAGTEIFVEYGDSWFEDREDMGLIPLSDDFRDADASLKKLLKLVNQTTKKLDKEMFHDVLQLLGNISASRPRMANAIPKSIDYDGLRHAVEDGTASLTVPNRVRSLSWLMENGRCLDNIEPSKSTIRQAGRGAFATRTIVKGEVIAPMPMVHVRRRHMNVFGGDDYNDKKASIWLDGQQLILNYCYGHPESSLLLFPYAPVVNYVNHQTLASGGVNADLRWSTLPNHKTEWLQRTPEELDSQSYAGLIMDMIATRDIAAGEEIFLFYGHQWDSSWKRFVYQWTPSNNELGYAATAELNRRWEWIKTKDEMVTSPYRFSNRNDVFTMCFVGSLWRVDDEQPDKEQDRVIQWTGSDDLFDTSSYAYPCDILERHFNISQFSSSEQVYDRIDSVKPVDLSYKVKLQLKRKKSIIVDFVPRKAIQFFDSKYMSDNFLRSAFRHEIHLPDSMVPNAWRDLKETK